MVARKLWTCTMREVTYEMFKHQTAWCPKNSIYKLKLTENLLWCLEAGKLRTVQELIVLPCLHSSPYFLFWRKIAIQSHSVKFLNCTVWLFNVQAWAKTLSADTKIKMTFLIHFYSTCNFNTCSPPRSFGYHFGSVLTL